MDTNLFFDYKKYDPEYANLPREYKYIDLKCMKDAVNIDLSKHYYHGNTQLFAIKKGQLEGQSFENYKAHIYENAENRKIGTLVDEFGYFDGDQFHYVNHHLGRSYNPQDLDIKIEKHEGNIQVEGYSIYPFMLSDSYLNMLDYLCYQMNL
ncbi:hypothetical protein [Wolbachia endosymbiont of Ctenocephalides felis wCfeT]|uniref:hypothetical protein n=1 Tax=Wolbachia endosymbiont of Ctenocephalides felis wCfeT TaxID=2732593 RepID=UPI001444D79C|nr:hypothetical protein [Wolbachia endosymbiont of Ctenocephalides felis wCfeT]